MKLRLAITFIAPIFVLTLAGQARAFVECETDADCIDGFICEEVGVAACAMPDCPEGEECPDFVPCEEEVFYACVPGPCDSDDDCAEGMACVEVAYADDCVVSSEPCAEGEDCESSDPMEVPPCETVTETLCLPTWIGTCETDSDCGEGFECVAEEVCSASGSGDVPPPEDPEDPGVPAEEPECAPTEEKYCRPLEIECEDDAGCPEGWTCEDFGDDPTTSPCFFDEESGDAICEEPEPPVDDEGGFCMPPYFDEIGFGGGSDGGSVERATGHEDALPTERAGGHELAGGGHGCQAVPGASGATAAVFWMLPLLIGLARKRS
jgi:hypothetical protein